MINDPRNAELDANCSECPNCGVYKKMRNRFCVMAKRIGKPALQTLFKIALKRKRPFEAFAVVLPSMVMEHRRRRHEL